MRTVAQQEGHGLLPQRERLERDRCVTIAHDLVGHVDEVDGQTTEKRIASTLDRLVRT